MDRLTAEELRRLAGTDLGDLSLDPLDDSLGGVFADALERPMPMEAVEAIEQLAKATFRDVLADTDSGAEAADAFVTFFHRIGFLFKYKPYGVKAASPFGYSIFELHPGMGFSFQMHLEPKYEAFHILRAHPDSFLYLSTGPEWASAGRAAAEAWGGGSGNLESDFAFDPRPGDVVRVASTEIVHTVVGCTLEEFATTSVDAVERLLDQNSRSGLTLPDRHPDLVGLVTEMHPDVPSRLVERSDGGWRISPFSSGDSIIEVPGQMCGERLLLEGGHMVDLPSRHDWVNVIIPTRSPVRCAVAGSDVVVAPGEMLAVPPGWGAKVESVTSAVATLHSIDPALVLRDWSG